MNPASASTAPSTVCPIQTTAPVKMTVLTFSYPRRQDFQACVGHSNLQGMSNALRLKMHHISRHAIHRYSSVQSAASLPHAATERTLGKGWERGFVIYSASLEAVPIKQVFKIPVEQLELADQCSPDSFKGFVTPNRFCFDSFDHKSAQRL